MTTLWNKKNKNRVHRPSQITLWKNQYREMVLELKECWAVLLQGENLRKKTTLSYNDYTRLVVRPIDRWLREKDIRYPNLW
jgi:hypothetical protein